MFPIQAPVHAALVPPSLHVISSNISKNTCGEYCKSTNTFNIQRIAFILKHAELHSWMPASPLKAHGAFPTGPPWRAWLVDYAMLSVSASFVSCCQDSSARFSPHVWVESLLWLQLGCLRNEQDPPFFKILPRSDNREGDEAAPKSLLWGVTLM